LKASVEKLGTRLIDWRYRVGRELAKWQAELIADLGGPQELSTQKRVIIDLCLRSKLLIDSIDVWLLQQKSIINKNKRTLIGAVKERQAIADGLTRNLQLLGLDRKAKPALKDYGFGTNDGDTVKDSRRTGQRTTGTYTRAIDNSPVRRYCSGRKKRWFKIPIQITTSWKT
jgi:hypothetical protein